MAQIETGTGLGDKATVDATSKALRVTLYDSGGNEVNKAAVASYIMAINPGRITAAITAGGTLWGMRNAAAAARTIFIRRIRLMVGFDGTGAATTSLFDLMRYSVADLAGGTAGTPSTGAIKKRSSYGNTVLGDVRWNIGATLTVTGVTFGSAFASFGQARGATGGSNVFEAEFHSPDESFDCFELAAGEGIAIQNNVATVIGDSFSGFVEWDEY